MAKVQSETIETLLDFVKALPEPGKEPHWYRGCGKASYELIPTLYRHPRKKKIDELLKLENDLLAWFKQRSVPYLARELKDDWEWLFFMQHYRVPTRLLDWTENPFIALYFALTDASRTYTKGIAEYKTEAAVWVLKPGIWNRKALEEMGYAPEVLSIGDRALESYKPDPDVRSTETMKTRPVAMSGTHNSPRIVAQRGTFVIFGKNTSAMEDIYGREGFPRDALRKLEMPAQQIGTLLDSLIAVGMTESVVFPDLEGLAKEAKRGFGFEVWPAHV